jgi:hypothetical protein
MRHQSGRQLPQRQVSLPPLFFFFFFFFFLFFSSSSLLCYRCM